MHFFKQKTVDYKLFFMIPSTQSDPRPTLGVSSLFKLPRLAAMGR